MKYKIAILTQNDPLWSFAAWSSAIPLLKTEKDLNLRGVWICNEKLPALKKEDIKWWYLKTFGIQVFILLAFFFILFRIKYYLTHMLLGTPRNVHQICRQDNIPIHYTRDPNDGELSSWIKKNKIDILLIMTSYIITDSLLDAPALGIINKHAALLPANKGLFPYLWAKLKKQQQGFSFHKVIKKIDAGDILYQEIVPENYAASMVRFYYYIYKHFGGNVIKAIHNLVENKKKKPTGPWTSSYQGLPTKKDYKKFLRKQGTIISIKDVLLACKL